MIHKTDLPLVPLVSECERSTSGKLHRRTMASLRAIVWRCHEFTLLYCQEQSSYRAH